MWMKTICTVFLRVYKNKTFEHEKKEKRKVKKITPGLENISKIPKTYQMINVCYCEEVFFFISSTFSSNVVLFSCDFYAEAAVFSFSFNESNLCSHIRWPQCANAFKLEMLVSIRMNIEMVQHMCTGCDPYRIHLFANKFQFISTSTHTHTYNHIKLRSVLDAIK